MLRKVFIGTIISAWLAFSAHSAIAATAAEISKESQAALKTLYGKVPKAKELGSKALGVLVFPKVDSKQQDVFFGAGTGRTHACAKGANSGRHDRFDLFLLFSVNESGLSSLR